MDIDTQWVRLIRGTCNSDAAEFVGEYEDADLADDEALGTSAFTYKHGYKAEPWLSVESFKWTF